MSAQRKMLSKKTKDKLKAKINFELKKQKKRPNKLDAKEYFLFEDFYLGLLIKILFLIRLN